MTAVARRALFVLLLCPLLAAADDGPPVPTGHDLLKLSAEEVPGYVTGLYEGQLVMAMYAGVRPLICADPMLSQNDLVARFMKALPGLSEAMLRQSAHAVAMRVLMAQHPCPDAEA